MKKIFWTLLFVSIAICSHAQTNISAQIQNLLPTGNCSVDLMELHYPARFMVLTKRLQTAVSADKEWWMGYVKQHAASGGPLPYNPRFGLTKEEYNEFLSLGEKRTLEKVKSCKLVIKAISDNYEFDGGSDLPDFTGLSINVRDLKITTPE